MIVAFVEAARKRGVDVQRQVYVVATDLSEVAARMAYIQLSLRGIPAHVYWGNTISLEVFRTWATMAYWPIAHKVAKWRRGSGENPEPEPEPEPDVCMMSEHTSDAPKLIQPELFTL